jgi:filamentous hemagglutinin
VSASVVLASGGLTSVSAVDPATGLGAILPYGISFDGVSWIDPAGNDITLGGGVQKAIRISAGDLTTEAGSVIDIAGGGDLMAYRWISGNGGTRDILGSSGSFAVIPGYAPAYAPFAPFNPSGDAVNLDGQPGYVNSSLAVGDQVTLAGTRGLPAGTYTLLPARYALLPGAFLVTPKTGVPSGRVPRADGSWLVNGYRSNNLNPERTGPTRISRFEIASSKVLKQRADYQTLKANTLLREAAIRGEIAIPRLPQDAGYLAFSSSAGMVLRGQVTSATTSTGRGALIDVDSSSSILINETGAGGEFGQLVLSSRLLSEFGAESLLVGGIRTFDRDGARVQVTSQSLTLENEGGDLKGPDVILVSKGDLTLTDFSRMSSTDSPAVLDALWIGDESDPGSGNGSLVRVSGGQPALVFRSGVDTTNENSLAVGAGVRLVGESIVLDSTAGASLEPTAILQGASVSLSGGSISLGLDRAGGGDVGSGLFLSGSALSSLLDSARNLSLLSYATLDVFGSGVVGSTRSESIALRSASIRGFNTQGGSVSFVSDHILIENTANRTDPNPGGGELSGTIRF